jgi:hypothetical protein
MPYCAQLRHGLPWHGPCPRSVIRFKPLGHGHVPEMQVTSFLPSSQTTLVSFTRITVHLKIVHLKIRNPVLPSARAKQPGFGCYKCNEPARWNGPPAVV